MKTFESKVLNTVFASKRQKWRRKRRFKNTTQCWVS